MPRPKNTPLRIFKRKFGDRRKPITTTFTEEMALVIELHRQNLLEEADVVRGISTSDAVLDLLYRTRAVLDLLPTARTIIRDKQRDTTTE